MKFFPVSALILWQDASCTSHDETPPKPYEHYKCVPRPSADVLWSVDRRIAPIVMPPVKIAMSADTIHKHEDVEFSTLRMCLGTGNLNDYCNLIKNQQKERLEVF